LQSSHYYKYTVAEICRNYLDIWPTAALAGHHIAAVVVSAAGVAVTRAAPQRVRGQAKVLRLALVAVTPHHVPLTVTAPWKSIERMTTYRNSFDLNS
jgi:hypothetical protein